MTENQKKNSEISGFDSSLERLQRLVKNLEGGDLTLEESLITFEEGVRLARACQGHLAAAEQKVELLVKSGGDASSDVVELVPFAGDKSGG